MASNKKLARYSYLEQWGTRHGKSDRVVIRDAHGKFVDNISLTALRKGVTVKSR
jgi:hypothetical protein